MCRAKLPDSAEKMYADGWTIFFPIHRRMQQSDGSWGPLSRREQRQMDEVVRLWGGAAEQGHAVAQYNLGITYENGDGVDVNYKKAYGWYEKAAEQGNKKAQFSLGVMYKNGRGVDVNYKKVMEWFEKAAEQGHAKAQLCLGGMYHHGLGVDVNYKKAVE